jgi:hypothetical protein
MFVRQNNDEMNRSLICMKKHEETRRHDGPCAQLSGSRMDVVPSAPQLSCWYFMRSGCPGGNSAAPTTSWVRDWWAEDPSNGYAGEEGCAEREGALNGWCGTSDVRLALDRRARPASTAVLILLRRALRRTPALVTDRHAFCEHTPAVTPTSSLTGGHRLTDRSCRLVLVPAAVRMSQWQRCRTFHYVDTRLVGRGSGKWLHRR